MGIHQLKMVELIQDDQLFVTLLSSKIFRTARSNADTQRVCFLRFLSTNPHYSVLLKKTKSKESNTTCFHWNVETRVLFTHGANFDPCSQIRLQSMPHFEQIWSQGLFFALWFLLGSRIESFQPAIRPTTTFHVINIIQLPRPKATCHIKGIVSHLQFVIVNAIECFYSIHPLH